MILKIVPWIRVPKCGFPTPGESEVLKSSLLNSFLAKKILSVWNGYITHINQKHFQNNKGRTSKISLVHKSNDNSGKNCQDQFFQNSANNLTTIQGAIFFKKNN